MSGTYSWGQVTASTGILRLRKAPLVVIAYQAQHRTDLFELGFRVRYLKFIIEDLPYDGHPILREMDGLDQGFGGQAFD